MSSGTPKDTPPAETVRLTVDGKELEVPKGILLVEALRSAGTPVPAFCYHPKLDPAGLCRMCLVEVEKMPKLITACTTPAADGMVVYTNSGRVTEARRGMLEFTLINHPLDCPVCDKGGECDLQDLTMRYGPAVSRLSEAKVHQNKAVPLGPFIVLDEERCILCRRCVRFDDEIAREQTLTVADRGVQSVITTAEGRPYDSRFSGNTIELCPVGALTSRPYRFQARPWDLVRSPSVCSQCSVGCNLHLDVRRGELLRVTAREHPGVDDGWLCDRGRFGYRHVHGEERLQSPLLRQDGELREVSWEQALDELRSRLLPLIRDGRGDRVGIIGGGRLTDEEAYLLQKLGRAAIGTPHLDHRTDAQRVVSLEGFEASIIDVDRADRVLLLDLDLADAAPVIDLRLRRRLRRRSTRVYSLGGRRPVYRDPIESEMIRPDRLEERLDRIVRAVEAGRENSGSDEQEKDPLVSFLSGGENILLFWSGSGPAGAVRRLLEGLRGAGKNVGLLIPGRQHNRRGAEFMGLLPGYLPGFRPVADEAARKRLETAWARSLPAAPGMDTEAMLQCAAEGGLEMLYLVGANLLETWPDRTQAARALNSPAFVVVQDLFLTETARQADLVLPAVSFAEKQGTATNLEGRPQALRQAVEPAGDAWDDGRIFVALAARLRYRGFAFGEGATAKEMEQLGLLTGAAERQLQRRAAAHQVAVSLDEALGRRPSDALRPRDPALGPERALLDPDSMSRDGFRPGAPGALWEEGDRDRRAGAAAWRAVRVQGEALCLRLHEPLFTGGGTAWHDKDLRPVIPEPVLELHPSTAERLGWNDGGTIRLDIGGDAVTVQVQWEPGVAEGLLEVTRALPGHPANALCSGGDGGGIVELRRQAEEVQPK